MRFNDLVFQLDPDTQMKRAKVFFPNGYGASVVIGPFSLGGPEGLYEMMVLTGTPGRFVLSFDNPVSNNCSDPVLGHLSEPDVSEILEEIEQFPAVNPLAVTGPEANENTFSQDDPRLKFHEAKEQKPVSEDRFLDL